MFQNILHPLYAVFYSLLYAYILCLFICLIKFFMQKPKENNTYSFNNYKYKEIKF